MEPELAEFPCPVCGGTEFRVLYVDTLGNRLPEFGYDFSPRHTDHYRIVRCAHCRHVYCSPRLANLHCSYLDVQDDEYLRNEAQRVATYEKIIDTIRRFNPDGRLLDVGCAIGDFLSVARRYYNTEGLELSRWAAALARKKAHTVHCCRLSELNPDAPYDVLTMWGVIEHFEYPRQELTEIGRLLKHGGLVCLWTGDIDSLPSRLLGAKWWYVQGQHIQFFSLRSLDSLFASAGFTRVHLERYPYVMSFRSIAKSLSRYRLLGAIANRLLGGSLFEKIKLTLRLPGELFAIYRKSDQAP